MADPGTVTLHAIDLLRQILNFLEVKQSEVTVALPAQTTVKAALGAVEDAFTDEDGPILLMHRGSNTHRSTEARPEDPFVLPIRPHVEAPSRPSISEQRRQRLRELARRMAGASEWREKYVSEAAREGAN
ncbi:hypothetical protein BDW75DRAFT_244324 [Aspergillus navahoensis]